MTNEQVREAYARWTVAQPSSLAEFILGMISEGVAEAIAETIEETIEEAVEKAVAEEREACRSVCRAHGYCWLGDLIRERGLTRAETTPHGGTVEKQGA